MKNSEGLRYCQIVFSLSRTLFYFLLINNDLKKVFEIITIIHGDPTDMRKSTSVFQIGPNSIKDKCPRIDSRRK